MIIVNDNSDSLVIYIANRCQYDRYGTYYLWLKNVYTKELFFFRVRDAGSIFFDRRYSIRLSLNVTKHIPHGEYEYYLTPQSPNGLYIDINGVTELERDIYTCGKSRLVLSEKGYVFIEKGCDPNLSVSIKELFGSMHILANGLLQYKRPYGYHELNKEQGYYDER